MKKAWELASETGAWMAACTVAMGCVLAIGCSGDGAPGERGSGTIEQGIDYVAGDAGSTGTHEGAAVDLTDPEATAGDSPNAATTSLAEGYKLEASYNLALDPLAAAQCKPYTPTAKYSDTCASLGASGKCVEEITCTSPCSPYPTSRKEHACKNWGTPEKPSWKCPVGRPFQAWLCK